MVLSHAEACPKTPHNERLILFKYCLMVVDTFLWVLSVNVTKYIGESGRKLETLIKEHKKDITDMKAESGVTNHVSNTGHSFDFNNAKIVFGCNNVARRHIVESALIKCHYSKQDRSVNLNNGSSPQNELLSYYVTSLLRDTG